MYNPLQNTKSFALHILLQVFPPPSLINIYILKVFRETYVNKLASVVSNTCVSLMTMFVCLMLV